MVPITTSKVSKSTTDMLQLNSTKMFAEIRAGIPTNLRHTQNLLEVKDDILFAWNAKTLCVLALNWRALQSNGYDNTKYQSLLPSTPLNFNVERLLASNDGAVLALAGPRGVAILDLPSRWGKDGLYAEGKEKITCRCTNLDAQFFSNNPHLELRQLRWHPDSPTSSHLLILFSDNTIRVYDNGILRRVWQVGAVPQRLDNSLNGSLPSGILALGEIAVDFDIAPAITVADGLTQQSLLNQTENGNNNTTLQASKNNSISSKFNKSSASMQSETTSVKSIFGNEDELLEWPIIILRENGNIFVLMTCLETDKTRLQGPLIITPEMRNNYGDESCSVLVMPSMPPTIVIAEANGRIHHALLLEAEELEESLQIDNDQSLSMHPCEWTLHVVETIELELALPQIRDEATTPQTLYKCPIFLKRDCNNEHRYFAYHNAGLHGISINFIDELQRFLDSETDDDISLFNNPAFAEHVICSKYESSENQLNPVLGFVLLQTPCIAVVLAASGEVLSIKLNADTKLLEACQEGKLQQNSAAKMLAAGGNNELQRVLETSFVERIKSLLKHEITQPFLSLNKSAAPPGARECYDIYNRAKAVFRKEYMQRHDQVQAEFIKRINFICLQKEQQKRDIELLEEQREMIREQAHKLSDRVEEICDQQEVLVKKCQKLLMLSRTRVPDKVVTDQELDDQIHELNKETQSLAQQLKKSREELKKQTYHINKYKESGNVPNWEMPAKQEADIKEILAEMSTEIDAEIKEIHGIRKTLNL